jgi:REP element-mobilizing transposase RayT
MPERALAFHITFGTYGTRLHGDPRGTVDRSMNRPGDPIIGRDDDWQRFERSRLRFDPIVLSRAQMVFAEQAVPPICERGGWQLWTTAAGPDHIHVVLTPTPDVDGEGIRRIFKRWLGQALSQRWPLQKDATWWAEGGSVRWVWTQQYFDNVYGYVDGQRASGPYAGARS